MKKSLNMDLLEFHIREAAWELGMLMESIEYAEAGRMPKGTQCKEPFRWPLTEGALAASLEHAYHHLNFAWNGRFKTMQEADAQFSRNEKFPRPFGPIKWFAKFWPKSLLPRGR